MPSPYGTRERESESERVGLTVRDSTYLSGKGGDVDMCCIGMYMSVVVLRSTTGVI